MGAIPENYSTKAPVTFTPEVEVKVTVKEVETPEELEELEELEENNFDYDDDFGDEDDDE